MLKVLHILSLRRRAGVEVMFINFLKQMKHKDPKLLGRQIVFAIGISKSFKEELEKLGVTYSVAKSSSKYNLTIFLQIRKIIKDYNIDLVYGQNFEGNFWGALACIGKNDVNLLCHEHGTAWMASGHTSLLTYFWTNKADLIICNANAAKVLLNQRFKVPLKKLRVIYNGVPEKKSGASVIKKNENLILFVGRLDPVKSPDTVIRSLPYLVAKLPNIRLEILGEGLLEKELKQLTRKLKVNKYVNFRGNVTNVSEYMAEAALLILPSVRESLGNVIIEAAFQKTPTIGTNIDGIAEVIQDGRTGSLIDPELDYHDKVASKYVVNPDKNILVRPKKINPVALADQIYKILITKKYIEFGERANQHAKEKFSINKYYHNIIELITTL